MHAKLGWSCIKLNCRTIVERSIASPIDYPFIASTIFKAARETGVSKIWPQTAVSKEKENFFHGAMRYNACSVSRMISLCSVSRMISLWPFILKTSHQPCKNAKGIGHALHKIISQFKVVTASHNRVVWISDIESLTLSLSQPQNGKENGQ